MNAVIKPHRFKLSRKRGYRMPAGGVSVANSSRFANPYRPARTGLSNSEAVAEYRKHLAAHPDLVADAKATLKGKPLGCYCELDQPCHADVLIDVASG